MKDFEILSRDTVVAVWKDNELKVLNNDLLPLPLLPPFKGRLYYSESI